MDNALLQEQLEKLRSKYENMGQDMNAYLDGLLLSNYLPYWDYNQSRYTHVFTTAQTDFPDELIFIIYHQITELYFRLSLHEYEQIGNNGEMSFQTEKTKAGKTS